MKSSVIQAFFRTLSLSSKRQFLDAQQINSATYCKSPVHEAPPILITLLSFSTPPSCGVLRVWSAIKSADPPKLRKNKDNVDHLIWRRPYGFAVCRQASIFLRSIGGMMITQGFELRTDIVNVVYIRGFGLEMVSVVSPQIIL